MLKLIHVAQKCPYSKKLKLEKTFAQKGFFSKMLLRKNAFVEKCFCSKILLLKNAFAQKCFCSKLKNDLLKSAFTKKRLNFLCLSLNFFPSIFKTFSISFPHLPLLYHNRTQHFCYISNIFWKTCLVFITFSKDLLRITLALLKSSSFNISLLLLSIQ